MRKFTILFLLLICSVCFGDIYTSHQKPTADSTLDLGTSSLLWRYIYSDAFTDNTASWLDNSLSGFIDITATDTITGVTLTDGTFSVSGGIISAGTWQGSTIVVSYGGTGATTLTDGGILLGSGTGAVTALGVASNGQIPIGDGATDPVLATITGSTGINVTNGAGTITLDVNFIEIDHGSLGGLGGDDHKHYILVTGTRDLTGDWTISTNSITLTLGTLTAEQITSTDDLGVTGTGTFGDIIVDNLSIDGFTITSSTNLVIDANGGNSDARIEADDDIYLQANDFVYIQPSADVADYIALRTLIGVPEITTVGNCDLRISASSGEIDFRDENLTTTGHLQAANFTTDEVTNNTVFVGDDSGGSGTNNVYVGEHAGENATSSYGAGVGNYVLQNNTGSNPVANGFSTAQDNTGNYLTSGGYAAAQRNKGHRLTVSGGFAGQENLGDDATLTGYLAGQYNTENNAVSTGGNAGQWNTGANPTFTGGNTGRWNDSDNATSVGYNSFNLWTDDTASAKTFDNTAIDDVNDRITITTHGFGANNSYLNLMYDVGTSSIPGLTDGTIYQWKVISANIIELRIGDITGQGTGTGHTFTPKVCYANSSAFGYDAEPTVANQIMLGDTNVTQVKTAGTFIGTGLTLGDGSATDVVIHFDASAYDANIIFDESDNEFDFEDSNITTTGNLAVNDVTLTGKILHTYSSIDMETNARTINFFPDATYGKFSTSIQDIFGTNDIFFQIYPYDDWWTSNSILESYNHPFYIATGGADRDIYIAPNRTVIATFNSTGVQIGDDANYVEISATGDQAFVGTAGLPFGAFYGNNIAWTSTSFGGGETFVIISDPNITGGNVNGTTFQNEQELLIATAGKYLVTWSLSGEAAGANKHVEAAPGINGTANAAGRQHIETGHANEEYGMGGTAILTLAATNTLSLMITNVDDNTQVEVHHINLTAVQVGG